MHTIYKILLLAATIAVLGCTTQDKVARTPEKQTTLVSPISKSGNLESRLMGTWVLAKAAVPGTPSGIGIRRKIFTPGRWEMLQVDPATGKVVFNHGGTYRLVGDELEQTVEFASQKTANYVGQVRRFKITVEGDVYTQVGIGNQFSEVWKRVPNAK